MTRSAFYSYHHKPDHWRAAKIRNMGVLEGNKPVSDKDWEEIISAGDPAIEKWINGQLSGKSVAVVLIGAETAGRKWINYEITKAWDDNKGLLGIYIHNIADSNEEQSNMGRNPFIDFTLSGVNMSKIVKAYDPPYFTSTSVCNHIKENVADWVEKAIETRAKYKKETLVTE